jgi:hypothetical protein
VPDFLQAPVARFAGREVLVPEQQVAGSCAGDGAVFDDPPVIAHQDVRVMPRGSRMRLRVPGVKFSASWRARMSSTRS